MFKARKWRLFSYQFNEWEVNTFKTELYFWLHIYSTVCILFFFSCLLYVSCFPTFLLKSLWGLCVWKQIKTSFGQLDIFTTPSPQRSKHSIICFLGWVSAQSMRVIKMLLLGSVINYSNNQTCNPSGNCKEVCVILSFIHSAFFWDINKSFSN